MSCFSIAFNCPGIIKRPEIIILIIYEELISTKTIPLNKILLNMFLQWSVKLIDN